MVATPFGVVRRAEKKHLPKRSIIGKCLAILDSTLTPLGLSFALSVWTLVIIGLFLCGNHCGHIYFVSPASIQRALSGENENTQS
jgi:hypothetical protein